MGALERSETDQETVKTSAQPWFGGMEATKPMGPWVSPEST